MTELNQSKNPQDLLSKLAEVEREIVECAKEVVESAADPLSGVINFLHQRPENEKLEGSLVELALLETFGSEDKVPGLIQAIAKRVDIIIRQSNVIKITNQETILHEWGKFIIKKTETMKFEVAHEKGVLVLKNISGLFGIESGIELPLEKIQVKPPKIIVTAKMGLMRPQRVLDI